MPEWMRFGGTYGARVCYAPDDAAAGGGAAAAADAGGAAADAGQAAAGSAGAGAAAGQGDAGAAASGADGDEGAKVAADFPDDWRERLAGGDEKFLGRLKRFQSPASFAKSWQAAQDRIARGEIKSPLPENATPEQIAEWRKENGVPEKPEGYLEKLPDGLVIGEADKPLVGKFVEAMHGKNVAPDVVNAALGAWRDIRQQQIDAILAKDEADKSAADDTLRAEWGGDFKRNNAAIEGVLVQYGSPEVAKGLLDARMPDGTLLRNSPDAMRLLAGLAVEINPAHTVVPGAGANAGQTIADEIGKIETMMRDRKSEYWRGPNAERIQSRYRDLITARDKMKSRAA